MPGSVRILRLPQFSQKIPQHRDLPGGLRFHHVIQAVFLRQLQPSCALRILRCQNIAGITQLIPCQLQLLLNLIQRGDVLLPEHPAAAQPVPLQKRIIVQMDGIHPHLPQLIWRQSPPHGNRHILGAKCLIRDLDRQTRCLKKFVVSEVGLDQPALNAAFKDARKNQALRHRHIARKHPDPIDFFNIRASIGQRKRKRNQRQPANSPAAWDAAVFRHRKKREPRAQGLPTHHKEIAALIPILPIR